MKQVIRSAAALLVALGLTAGLAPLGGGMTTQGTGSTGCCRYL